MTPRRLRSLLALALAASGLVAALAGFLGWLVVAIDTGGRTVVNGWGAISGNAALAGENLNGLTGGDGSFRPALLPLSLGVLLVAGAIALLPPPRGEHPYRIGAALTALVGVVMTVWGVIRLLDPDPLAILEDGEAAAGAGPWVVAVCGLIGIAATTPIFAGRVDELAAPRPRSKGIQP